MERRALILVDINPLMVAAWNRDFAQFANVRVIAGSIFETQVDAIVSPANSFGIMDGGLDGKIRDYFGVQLERRVRHIIQSQFFGELPVGMAIMVETGMPTCPYLISAPTMRTPENVSTTINAYLAMKAILHLAQQSPAIRSVAVPGLCSMSGQMAPAMVSRQMRIAYERVMLQRYQYTHWREEKQFERYIRHELPFPPEDLERPWR